MGKRERLKEELQPLLLDESLYGDLETMLLEGSNLPGPRANLELARAFADCFMTGASESQWELLNNWVQLSDTEAPVDSPREFLPFCALQALGAVYLGDKPARQAEAIGILKKSARDTRWRIREAVAVGFQIIGEKDFNTLRTVFSAWVDEACFSERRAILAALAHPPMLKEEENVRFCFAISDKILAGLREVEREERRSKWYKILRQGLEYTLSVFVENSPEEGFEFLKKWAEEEDSDIRRIIKANLGKARLAKKHGHQTHELLNVFSERAQ